MAHLETGDIDLLAVLAAQVDARRVVTPEPHAPACIYTAVAAEVSEFDCVHL